MPLEERGKYTSKAGIEIHTKDIVGENNLMYSYTGLVGKIVSGLTANLTMPGGFWDTETGKCISANTGGLKGKKYDDVLEGLSIEIK